MQRAIDPVVAARSAMRNIERKAAQDRRDDEAAAHRENAVRDQAASMGVNFDEFMAADA